MMPPFAFCHHPQELQESYVLCGHLHLAVQLRGRGQQQARLACFWFGPRTGVLPAFGSFTGSALIPAAPGDRVFAVTPEEVVPIQDMVTE